MGTSSLSSQTEIKGAPRHALAASTEPLGRHQDRPLPFSLIQWRPYGAGQG